ncbi:MAG TPA: hypothetical protein VGC41_21850 [Kofleriaceae bacterium]
MISKVFWIGLVAALTGCPPPEPVRPPPIPPVSTGKVRVRVFTEPSPVKDIGSAGKYLFVATDDSIQRWDDTGAVMVMTADHGLSGDHVTALAADHDRKWLWVLTDGGLGHYDAQTEVYTELSAPPAALDIDYQELAKDGASLTAAVEGGVWLGTPKGLVFASDKGGWLALPVKDAVRAIVRDKSNYVWIATKGGLLARKPNGDVIKIGASVGCEVADPRLLVEAPGDRVMVFGSDLEGHERIAIGNKSGWTSYRALPEIAWDAATREGDSVMLMGGGRVYRVQQAQPNTAVRPLARDGARLVATTQAGVTNDWVIDPIDMVLPPSPTMLGSAKDELLVGTRDLGTARYARGDSHPRDWLRRKQMFEDANALTVACHTPNDCWVATGARQAWHWNGERLSAGGPDQIVLAVSRDPSGAIFALHRTASDKEIHMSRIDPTAWTPIAKVALETPGDVPEISFARFQSATSLWVGLRYRDGAERRAYGVAIVEPATGKVTYHRTEQTVQKSKMLPIPIGVVDADLRGDVAWFATSEGVARLQNNTVKVWTEADGLRSELARAVTIAQDGTVFVGTGAGAAVWNGKVWTFPPALQFEINDLVATHNGQVWMATERGIAAWDGKKVRRVDTRRGLTENSVLDVAADQFDRVWARGPGSLTLISQ